MPLNEPIIDQASYRRILDEALARIRVHNPDWTNYNDSDPGVTLLQLFAFMTENLLYRSNLIPERNRIAFLKLLGIPLQPAEAARGLVAFANARGPLEPVVLPRDLEVRAGPVPFRTRDGLEVLPVEGKLFYKKPVAEDTPEGRQLVDYYRYLFEPMAEEGRLAFYETTALPAPKDPASIPEIDLGDKEQVIDGALWLALLARGPGDVDTTRSKLAGRELSLGVFPALEAARRTIPPDGLEREEQQPALVFDIATGKALADGKPRYDRLPTESDGGLLAEPSVVKLRLPQAGDIGVWRFQEPKDVGTGLYPPALEENADQARLVTWVRIRLPAAQTAAGLSARLNHVAVNAARVVQRTRVADEYLGEGTGAPDQVFTLANTPVISGSVVVTIGGEAWREVRDLSTAAPEVPRGEDLARKPRAADEGEAPNVFALDREAGTISFGDGLHGGRPPVGAVIRAAYAYGGGTDGNVGIGAIGKSPNLPAGITLGNPLPTWGGDEPETAEEGQRNIAAHLRHRDRLVSEEDFLDITRRTPGIDIGRAEILSLFNPALPDVPVPGAVTVMVIPRTDAMQPNAPQPDRRMLDLVCDYLRPRRLVTTELHVRGPNYKDVIVSAGIKPVAGRDFPVVRQAVEQAIRQFLSPLAGGREGAGWPLDKPVVAKELLAEAARVDGVSYVINLRLGDGGGEDTDSIAMTDLDLPRLVAVSVSEGEPEPLDAVLNRTGGVGQDEEGRDIVPIPVVPSEC